MAPDRGLAAIRRSQRARAAAGLKWYGGRPPKLANVEGRLEKALVAAQRALETLPHRDDSSPAGMLAEGAREGLMLGKETVMLVREVLARDRENVDVRLLRAGNDAGAQLYKSALSAQEAQYQAQRDDDLARLIELIAEEKAKK